jgi:hypothetical protein
MSNKKIGPPFKIIPGSIVKATKGGYYYCQTDPVHPNAEKRSDRKARYIYVHIVKMENHLGRLLDSKVEQVDHKDKDKSNNDISNLKLVLLGEHQKDHVSRGNHFWENSPRIKPRKGKKKTSSEMVNKVLLLFLRDR